MTELDLDEVGESMAPGRLGSSSPVSKISPFHAFSLLVGVGTAFLILYPFSRVLIRLFWVDGSFNIEPFRNVIELPNLGQLMFNTFALVIAGGSLALVAGFVLAWLNERTDARVGALTDILPLLPFIMPVIAAAAGWVIIGAPRAGYFNYYIREVLQLVGIHMKEGPFDIFTWYGLIFVYALYLIPYPYLLVSAGLRNLDPSLEEQARVCGAGLWRTLWRVTLPNVWPSIAGSALIVATIGFAMISVPILIGTGAEIEVISTRIVRLLNFTYPPRTAEAVGLSVVVLVVLVGIWRLQARLIRGGRFATIGGRAARGRRIELGKWRWIARSLTFGYVFFALIAPLYGLLITTLNGFWSPKTRWSQLTLDHFRTVLWFDQKTRDSLFNSVYLGLVGATIGMIIAATISTYVQRSTGKTSTINDGIAKLPAAVSGLILAVGFILAFAGPPFGLQGTMLILLLAFIATHMPSGSIAADGAASQVGHSLLEAAYVSGASESRTFRKISIPLMLPGLVAGWSLLFVRYAGDFQASAILSSTSNQTAGKKIVEIYEMGSYAYLAALAMGLTAITGLIIGVVFALTRKRAAISVV